LARAYDSRPDKGFRPKRTLAFGKKRASLTGGNLSRLSPISRAGPSLASRRGLSRREKSRVALASFGALCLGGWLGNFFLLYRFMIFLFFFINQYIKFRSYSIERRVNRKPINFVIENIIICFIKFKTE
jgi:hypothetical protein